jgi:hypothetical protein
MTIAARYFLRRDIFADAVRIAEPAGEALGHLLSSNYFAVANRRDFHNNPFSAKNPEKASAVAPRARCFAISSASGRPAPAS